MRAPQSARIAWRLALCGFVGLLSLIAPAAAEPFEDDPQAAARDPDYAAGKEAMQRKDWAAAALRFQRALLRDPDNPDLQNYLGFTHRQLKRFDLAFSHYKRALELSPRHRGAHEYIGEAYLLVGDLASAEKHLAALRDICLLPCEELDDLANEVAGYRARHPLPAR